MKALVLHEGAFITDTKGKRVGVTLDLKTYERLREAEEDLTHLHAYDAARPKILDDLNSGRFSSLAHYRTKASQKQTRYRASAKSKPEPQGAESSSHSAACWRLRAFALRPEPVAQIFNLLYRRVALGKAVELATWHSGPTPADSKSAIQQSSTLRYRSDAGPLTPERSLPKPALLKIVCARK